MSTPDFDEMKRHRRLGRKMVSLYKEVDPLVKRGMEGLNVSCKEGCASCCYLMVLVSLPEAVAIAAHILGDVERRKQVPELSRKFWEQAKALEEGQFAQIRTQYFKKQIPCAFLDTEKKTCTVYDVRPPACRYHYVVSDPALCSPDSDANVQRVDTANTEDVCLSEANRVSKQTKLPLFVAPMPITMLWAFKLLIEGRSAFDAALRDPNLGVLNLAGWISALRLDESKPQPEALPEKTPTPETAPGGSA